MPQFSYSQSGIHAHVGKTSWAKEKFESLELGDKLLNTRMVLLAERRAERPTATILEASHGLAETQWACRLIAKENGVPQKNLWVSFGSGKSPWRDIALFPCP